MTLSNVIGYLIGAIPAVVLLWYFRDSEFVQLIGPPGAYLLGLTGGVVAASVSALSAARRRHADDADFLRKLQAHMSSTKLDPEFNKILREGLADGSLYEKS